MNLIHFFERAVRRFPNVDAIVDDEVRWTYRDVAHEVELVSANLWARGIREGNHVLVVLKNRRENIVIYWARQRLGAIYTPLNFRMSDAELAYCIKDSDPALIVAEGSLRAAIEEVLLPWPATPPVILVDAGHGVDTYDDLLRPGSMVPPVTAVDDNQAAIMLYTAGTTGQPKGVPRSHVNESTAATAHIIQNHYQMHESTVGVMPFYHTMGMRSLLSTVFLNGRLVLLPDYDTGQLAEIIEQERISSLYLVPTLYYDLMNLHGGAQRDFHHLRKIGYAGSAMTGTLTQQCFEQIQPEVFVNHFGSSEVYTYTTCSWLDRKPTCAGRAGFHQEIRIFEVNSVRTAPDVIETPDRTGEIVVSLSSPEAFSGYWKRPDATAETLNNGWYFTGDVGMWDDEGDLWVQGRVDDMMISGGENIHPLEVEEVLSRHPQVAEVAVVGLPDPRWGQVVTAFVVPRELAITEEALDRYCRSSTTLANFKRPRRYVFVREIPKSPVGKILRRMLREGRYSAIG